MKYQAVIFDIDGVLACNLQRKHYIEGKSPDWKTFFKECATDSPLPAVDLLKHFYHCGNNEDIFVIILSSRPEWNREETEYWLKLYSIPCDELILRPNKYEDLSDEVFPWKTKVIEGIYKKYDILFIFEDDPVNIASFQSMGYPVIAMYSGYYNYPCYHEEKFSRHGSVT
jgi:hypothetical protein